MIKQLATSIAIASSLLLSGCGINQPTPEMKYHLLDHRAKALNHRLPTEKIAVNKVVLADYLTQPNLVMRVADNRLDLASYHSWAEPLDAAIQRILIDELNQAQLDFGFVERCRDCTKVNLYVDHFYPDQAGNVVLSGRFTIDKAGEAPIVEYFAFSQEQSAEGYSESVKVMNELLEQMTEKVKQVIVQ